MSNLSSGPQSHHHHKSRQNSHHSHSGSNLSNQGSHNKNSTHGLNPGSGPGAKKNVRAWGNINSNSIIINNNNNNNNNNNTMSNNGGPAGAWRNGSPSGNLNPSPHFANGIPQTSSSLVSNYNQQHPHHMHSAAVNDDKLVMKAMHDRMVWFIMTLVGVTVTATTKSGQRFQGLLSSAVTEAELCITLKRAVELPIASTSSTPAASRTPPVVKSTLIILAKELVEVVASDIDLDQVSSVAAGAPQIGTGFKTDAETLGYRVDSNGQPIIREKELKTWAPSAADLPASPPADGASKKLSDQEILNGLEDALFPKGGDSDSNINKRTFDQPWDQFEANEKLFGTRTDFDEEISSNPHVQEERGMAVADDSGMNEEDKYGAVIRGEGAYVPPGARKGAAANRGALQPPANKTAVALQSQGSGSSMARHLKSTNESDAISANAKANISSPGQGPKPQGKPLSSNASPSLSTATSINNVNKDFSNNQTSQALRQITSQASSQATLQASVATPVPLPSLAQPSTGAANPTIPSTRKTSTHQQTKLTKPPDEVTPRFKAFVSDEKERLQQKKKDLLKKEKETRLADLRAFSLSFKLPMALPKDLEPIIKKSANPAVSNSSEKVTAALPEKDPRKLQQIAEDAGRRASTTLATTQEKSHVRYLSKVHNPSNLQIVATVNSTAARVLPNQIGRPPIHPSVAIGLKRLGPLAVIPPYKPNKQKAIVTSSTSTANPTKESSAPTQPKVASRFADIPPIPPFKPKNNLSESSATSMVAKDLKMNQKTAAFNPSAKTFSPVPGQKNSGHSNRKSSQPQEVSSGTSNPFFGNKTIKKGSSSMHVKEEFTPFKNYNVPEASSVGPAWSFTGKSYRQLFGASIPSHHHAPSHHHPHFVPHMAHHPGQHPPQHAHHHNHQHPQPHNGGGGNNHPQSHHPQSMMSNMMAPPMHMQQSQQPHQSHHHHQPNVMSQMISEEDGMPTGMNNNGHYMMGNGPGVIVNGHGMMVAGTGAGMPVPGSHGYIPNNAPGIGQQQQPHPHHLPPPIPPYMYHPQQQQPPPHPSPQSPYNGSYRHSHNGPTINSGVPYGPPIPVGVNIGGPVPASAYPPVGPGSGPNNSSGPYMGQMSGYGGSPMMGPGPVNNQNPGVGHNGGGNGGGSNGSNSQAHVYSPQLGGMPGRELRK
ncbi:hypothetical protein BY996DRAFT_3961166 [Phakopsora pachyrhizi]|nr:hypothetical protein BY996DRAFT_3961166 [Phakopsora pachyrhizi]